ncbi:site-specific integrase [Methylobacterium sp. E-025]|uniref:tyrosine-type recombinase/integrase n=1 Tax=Methylobacterium sp. E-025 TaxID=2836561 RepID=UPI001FBBEAB4|nr:site-specific integrase [Methylobacterium sp. E-025]MCJ2111891.1 site-specific integrase [Methylobacterium sp. E-025]
MPKITKRLVEATEPNGRDYFIWCDELPGFGVRVFASGRCSYLVQYRHSGRTRRVTIGFHGPVTAEDARKSAKALLGSVARGEDPAQEKATSRAAMTVAELCDGYLDAANKGLIMGKRKRPKKAKTLYVDRGRILRHIKPLLGTRRVRDLTTVDIQRFLRDVQTGKTAVIVKTGLRGKAVVKGGPGTAARTVGLLGGILSYARTEGIISVNPVFGVKKPADNTRDRRLRPEEFHMLGKALSAREADGETWQATALIRLLTLTGCRLTEILDLLWSEVDLDYCELRLADSKEGASLRPLGARARAVFEALPRGTPTSYVLPGIRGARRYGGHSRAIERAEEASGVVGLGAHLLRHSFGSSAADLGYSESTIGAMLGHAGHTVTSLYIHHLDEVLIDAADRTAEAVWQAMETGAGPVMRRRPVVSANQKS